MTTFLSMWPWRGELTARPATMREISEAVAARYGLPIEQLKGPDRKRSVAWARQEAFDAIYATGRYSLPQIGRYFNRDHTTVLHGVRRVRALAQQEAA